MSKVFSSVEAYRKDVADKAELSRQGGGTHAVQQASCTGKEWEPPYEGWTPPVVPETKSQAVSVVSPAGIDIIPPNHTTPPSTHDLQMSNMISEDYQARLERLSHLIDEEESYHAQ